MASDPLARVLQLVAEGRLTADEAAPILAALEDRPAPTASGSPSAGPDRGTDAGRDRDAAPGPGSGGPSTIRVEITDGGRQVVNLRLPIAVGRLALDRVPGLSGEQVERVGEALRTGLRGPILLVEDGDDVVRIVLE